jgi:hypothetical protein
MSIGLICRGHGSHLTCYEDYRDYIDEMIYVRAISEDRLRRPSVIVVADWNNIADQPQAI